MSGHSTGKDGEPSKAEVALAAVALLVCLALRVTYIHRYRFDSDEPQHLHVVWEWLQGGVAYRDFFDNHVPLFHLLFAPILKWVGERADALVLMRLWQLPVFIASLWFTWRIALRLYSKRAAMWSAVLLGVYPYYFYPTIEFRPDNLWGLAWLAALLIGISGRLTIARSFCVGLVLGLDFAFSMKTSILLAAGLLALAGCYFAVNRVKFTTLTARLGAGLGGMLVVPAAVMSYFSAQGAWESMAYCVIQHNLVATPAKNAGLLLHVAIFLLLIAGLWWIARRIATSCDDDATGARRAFVFLVASSFLALLHSFWSIITRQDFIPNDPLLVLLITPLLLKGSGKLAGVTVPAILTVGGVTWILLGRSIRMDETNGQIRYTAEVLSLTGPQDRVMDYKGECIFRHRPYYFVLEPMTRTRIKSGSIVDDIPERMIATQTCVALALTRRLSARSDSFLQSNYLPIGQSRVAGFLVEESADGTYSFDVKVAASYALLAGNELVAGTLDGLETTGILSIAAGRHRFAPVHWMNGKLAVFWEPAWRKGYSPFKPAPFEKFESEF